MTGLSDINTNATASDEPVGREELVAYLDGELDAEAARRLEERLRTDEALQQELQRLERTWDLLSTLPRTESNPSITKSTIEMLALESEEDCRLQAARRVRRRRLMWAAAAAMLFLAGWLGTIVARTMWPDPDAPLLSDLPVIRQRELYQQAGDIEFLRLLRQRGLFVSEDERQRDNTP
jgi:anti-sigma-K factor RskA